jgi:cytochrome P450
VAVEPCTREGLHVEPGQRVVVSIDTANHDAAVFADPDTFAIDRPGADAHLTFGWGPHFCVGAGLARVEMQEALRALVARFDAPVLDAIDPAAVPAGFSGPDALPVTFPLRADRGPART